MAKLLALETSFRLYNGSRRKYLWAEPNKLNANFLNIGEFGRPAINLEKCAASFLPFVLWLKDSNFIDDG